MAQSSIVSTDTQIAIFHLNENPLVTELYVDIAQCLSTINRRSYRQGMNYAVASIEMFSSDGCRIGVSTLPTTWVCDNATTKAFEAWKDQRAEVLREQPSLKAKWSDFKVFMDSAHSTLGVVANLTPRDASGNLYLLGDWDPSEYVIPVTGGSGGPASAQEVVMHVVGNHLPAGAFSNSVTSAGLIKSYANSRAQIMAPNPVDPPGDTTNMYIRTTSHDEMAADIMQNTHDKNDNPPYDIEDYPGGDLNAPTVQWHDTLIVRDWGDSTQFSSDTMGPFVAPFGLLKFNLYDVDPDQGVSIVIRCVPGKYKGILAERGV